MDITKILLCRCEYADVLPAAALADLTGRLEAAGVAFESVPDLCSLCERADSVLKRLAGEDGLLVIACYPRAVRWLFAMGEAPLGDEARILNLRAQSAEEIFDAIGPNAPAGGRTDISTPGDDKRVAWFPVIDYDRCTNCRQCLNFCLFDVFSLSAGDRPVVTKPLNCKLHCPACARVCPAGAIIFPKYTAGGSIGGGDVAETPAGEIDGVDLGAMMKGDVLAALRERSRALSRSGDAAAQGVSISPRLRGFLTKGIPDELTRGIADAKSADEKSADTKIADAKNAGARSIGARSKKTGAEDDGGNPSTKRCSKGHE